MGGGDAELALVSHPATGANLFPALASLSSTPKNGVHIAPHGQCWERSWVATGREGDALHGRFIFKGSASLPLEMCQLNNRRNYPVRRERGISATADATSARRSAESRFARAFARWTSGSCRGIGGPGRRRNR